ncbi:DUF2642 domain-containing protein [Effusibacillus consociatus]|uniref:DUF2642 domain-containing protein n=1 Tax=Effusibacillus consociatus TaxID=1117041 RepID=A0ABV9PU91_9BACL
MSYFQYIGKTVDLEISGKVKRTGLLIDCGLDILVIYDGKHFLYIPYFHIQQLKLNKSNDYEIQNPSGSPIDNQQDPISYRKILNNAKRFLLEIYVTGKQPIYGYLTNILSNYLVFYSPVYKTMFIPINHLKWLIPKDPAITPYLLIKQQPAANPSHLTLARTFREQLEKLEGSIVIFDLGEDPHRVGKLEKIQNNVVELVLAEGDKVYLHLQHLKTVHLP